MSLHNLANHVQSLGRGEDSQLVHMTPSEVSGLQSLAKAHGGSLSINPSTGLPEAGFLSDILPTIAGSVVGAYAGPMAGAAVGGGLGYALSGGNLQKGLMSGIGAYGGSQIGANFMGSGASSLAAQYSPQAELAGTEALKNAGFQYGATGPITPQDVGNYLNSGQITEADAAAYGKAYSSVFSAAPSSLTTGLTDSSAWGKNAMPLGMLGLGVIGAANSGSTGINNPAGVPTPGYIRPYTYSQTKNPNFGQPGQAYFNQSYTAQTPILASNYNTTAMYPQPVTAAGGGLMELNAPMIGQNDVYPGSNQNASEYATSAQTPVSSSAINAGYEPRTDAYSGQMMARGGIASIRRFAEGGQAQGNFDDSGRWQEAAPQAEPTWKPTDPVKLQSMDQMLAGDASGKSYNPTEHGYEWNGRGFINPNGATLSVDANGTVTQALPSHKDYEFNGQYWNPAGENIAWHPETNQTAYKVDGVEVPIERQATKGIAALTDASGKPQMQMDANNQPIFTQPEGITQSKLWMDEYGAPLLASAALGGAAALGSGAIGAGTTMANAGAAGSAVPAAGTAGSENVFSGFSPTGSNAGYAGSVAPTSSLPTVASGAPVYSFDKPYTGQFVNQSVLSSLSPMQQATLGIGAVGGLASLAGGQGLGMGSLGSFGNSTTAAANPTQANARPIQTGQMPRYDQNTGRYVNAAQGGIMGNGYAAGGMYNLGGYSDGGRLLKGPGDGVSDSIPAQIGERQPARLADGEFVVPARIVSELGNGSTEAGAKQLYKMMDRIQAKRRKTKNMATDTKSYKALPA